MRADYPRFQALGAEIVAVAPHTIVEVDDYWQRQRLPFIGVADPDRRVFAAYDVQSTVWSLGQRPGLFLIDRTGAVRYAQVGAQQWDIPRNADVLRTLAGMAPEG